MALKEHKCNRQRGYKPETEAKYRPALELYATSDLSTVDICRWCEVSQRIFPLCQYLPPASDAGTQRHQVQSGGSRQYQDEPEVWTAS